MLRYNFFVLASIFVFKIANATIGNDFDSTIEERLEDEKISNNFDSTIGELFKRLEDEKVAKNFDLTFEERLEDEKVANNIDSTIGELHKRLEDLHVKKDTPAYRPPFRWHKIKGLYESYIHMYLHGKPIATDLRKAKVYDNNCFVTSKTKVENKAIK